MQNELTHDLNQEAIKAAVSNNWKLAIEINQNILKETPDDVPALNRLGIALSMSDKGSQAMKTFQKALELEPGTSKVIPLVSQGEPKVFSSLTIGEIVNLEATKYKIKIVSESKQFIGYLPDNISRRLIELLNAGYKYKVIMKSVNPKLPYVFIQETHTSKKLKGAPSFPLDDMDHLPSLSAGDSTEIPPLEIFDPLIGEE